MTMVKPTSPQPATQLPHEWEKIDLENPSQHVKDLGFKWKGKTIFIELENPPIDFGRYDLNVGPHEWTTFKTLVLQRRL